MAAESWFCCQLVFDQLAKNEFFKIIELLKADEKFELENLENPCCDLVFGQLAKNEFLKVIELLKVDEKFELERRTWKSNMRL